MCKLTITKFACLTLVGALSFACLPRKHEQQQEEEQGEEDSDLDPQDPLPNLSRASSGLDEMTISGSRFYSIWKKQYENRLAQLPTFGQSSRIPYSGSWYPEMSGSTNKNGALTAYDRAYHTSAASWESSHHNARKGDVGAEWSGHCNGFSAAASRHKEPMRDVRDPSSGQLFTRTQIKALLAEMYMSTKALFLGGLRCEGDQGQFITDPFSRNNPERKSKCEDINPASFHLALTNWIGVVKHPIIMDLSINLQVWNYPAYKYACNNCSGNSWKFVTKEQAISIIGGTGSKYIFNHAAKNFADVSVSIVYSDPGSEESIGNHQPSQPKKFRYILELNERGEVIGGEWAKENQKDHPDFVWVSLEPKTATGERQFGNPELDPEKVLALWRLSIDDPNPEEAIMEPVWETNWGKYSNFRVTIDGSTSGAVFLGKKTKLVIARSGTKFKNVDLDVVLNDRLLKTFRKTGDGILSFDFDSPPGMNNLSFDWKILSGDDTYYLRYYAVP